MRWADREVVRWRDVPGAAEFFFFFRGVLDVSWCFLVLLRGWIMGLIMFNHHLVWCIFWDSPISEQMRLRFFWGLVRVMSSLLGWITSLRYGMSEFEKKNCGESPRKTFWVYSGFMIERHWECRICVMSSPLSWSMKLEKSEKSLGNTVFEVANELKIQIPVIYVYIILQYFTYCCLYIY